MTILAPYAFKFTNADLDVSLHSLYQLLYTSSSVSYTEIVLICMHQNYLIVEITCQEAMNDNRMLGRQFSQNVSITYMFYIVLKGDNWE